MKKLTLTATLWLLLLSVALAALACYGASHWLLFLLTVAGVTLLLYECKHCIRPIGRRQQLLTSSDHHLLQKFASDTDFDDPELNAIKELFTHYSTEIGRRQHASLLDKQAQIHALQSQINPHFLYNTLESIRGQALSEGCREIAAMSEALAAFFRYSISYRSYLVTLREELANVKNYFLIQEYRFNNRFSLHLDIQCDDSVYDCYLPKLTIQPIVENAIFHGLETKLEPGQVVITVTITTQRLLLTISDNGIGMDEPTLQRLNNKITEFISPAQEGSRGTGIALVNVNRRIELVFGNEYGIHVYSTQGLGTDVEIVLPRLTEKGGFDET